MYNRYLSGEYIPTMPPNDDTVSLTECESCDNTPCESDTAVECKGESTPKKSKLDLSSILQNIHFDTDDLLLLAILWLLLRDNDDNDIILIVIALFVMGIF